MNAVILAALRPGGVFIVVDHSARAGTGAADAETSPRTAGEKRGTSDRFVLKFRKP